MPQGSLPERPVFTPQPVCVLVCWKKAGASGDAKATPPRVVIGPGPPLLPHFVIICCVEAVLAVSMSAHEFAISDRMNLNLPGRFAIVMLSAQEALRRISA